MLLGYPAHHNTGGFTSHRKFLADKEYGEALDCLVKACSDMLLLSPDGARVFVGKRCVHPQPDWWFVGGRIFPGETPVQSCCRLLQRELSLEIAPDRFQTVCCQSLAWGMRTQPPEAHGTTDSQVVLSLRLTEEEVTKVVLDPKEYTDAKWLPPAEILGGHFHPALKYAVASLLAAQKLAELRAACERGDDTSDDATLARLAREFSALADAAGAQAANDGAAAYRVVAPELSYECDVTTS